jgi:alpha-L-fucosidase
LLNDADVAALKGLGDLLRATFAVNLAKGARLKASNVRGGNVLRFGPALLTDNDRYSYWATDDSVKTPQLEMALGTEKTFNVIRLRENIKLGQRIDAYSIDAMLGGQWQEIAAGSSIGGNRLIRLGSNVTTSRLRLRIKEAAVCIALSDWGLFREPARQAAPVIQRDRNGMVSIAASGKLAPGASIRYTTNGLAPTPKSPVYQKPFALTDGGTVRAASFTAAGLPGDISTEVYGIPQQGWDVISAPDGSDGELAIDGDERTEWNSTVSHSMEALPAAIEIDMSRPQLIKGFTYLPRTSKNVAIPGEGLIDRWSFYTSNDGTHWTLVRKGEYNNIAANPVRQLVLFEDAVTARYFKFVGEHVIAGKGVRVAELGIVSK